MNYDNFMGLVKKESMDVFIDLDISIRSGLLRVKRDKLSASLNLNPYYQEVKKGVELKKVIDTVLNDLLESLHSNFFNAV